MSHYAEIDNDGIVQRVLVVEEDFIDSGAMGDPAKWIKTSYNTTGGIHKLSGTPLRKNYAGIGHKYDEARDAFIAQQPYPSWTLNETTCYWEAPTPMPTDSPYYSWDEASTSWVTITE